MRIIREHDINSWRRLYELAGSIKELAPWGYHLLDLAPVVQGESHGGKHGYIC